MILVTGAAGKTGQAVIRALAARGTAVRALVRRPEQVGVVQSAGAQTVVVGDMAEPAVLRRAVAGVEAVYHICPNMHPEEVTIGRAVIAAVQAAGGAHVVFHSVLHPQTEKMPHHWQKLRVEELLLESGLPFTILQPAVYMQNILANWQVIISEGIYRVPYGIHSRLSLVDLVDVAEVAALVLGTSAHQGSTYELVGQTLTQTEVAAVLGKQIGQSVRAESMPLSTWRTAAEAAGLGPYQIETLVKMFHYYDQYGLIGNPWTLAHLLRRSPTDLQTFLSRFLPE